MEFTDEYIKMCQEAKEIQEAWKIEVGDWVYMESGVNRVGCVNQYGLPSIKDVKFEDMYWTFLPLQHQLQDMVIPNLGIQDRLDELSEFSTSKYGESLIYGESFTFKDSSMEKILLAYVMLKLYQKKWNNTKEVWE